MGNKPQKSVRVYSKRCQCWQISVSFCYSLTPLVCCQRPNLGKSFIPYLQRPGSACGLFSSPLTTFNPSLASPECNLGAGTELLPLGVMSSWSSTWHSVTVQKIFE